jgi:hypothetical protein
MKLQRMIGTSGDRLRRQATRACPPPVPGQMGPPGIVKIRFFDDNRGNLEW